jgi:response regulator RpfG family c-di-GMP phosphodiesterase
LCLLLTDVAIEGLTDEVMLPGQAQNLGGRLQTSAHGSLTVLIAERERTVAQALARIVSDSNTANIAAAVATEKDALDVGAKLQPDVAILDLELSPNCALVAGLHALCPDTRIIVLSDRGEDQGELMVKALATGAVGAMYKEDSFEQIYKAMRVSTRHTPVMAEEAAGLLLNSYLDAMSDKRDRDLATIQALAAAVEARDYGTGRHLRRVTDLACSCMEKIDAELAGNEELSFGFLLHDVGKIGIPDSVLKKPGPLDDREWASMRQHPEIGVRIVDPIGFSPVATDVILCHHERWDGSGYPHGLAGDEIPITARAFSVADAFDAMTSDRPYRGAMPREEAKAVIRLDRGHRFDPEVVDAFFEVVA